MKRIFNSTTFIILGILCICGAGGLTAYNINHDDEVGDRTTEIEEKLEDYIFNKVNAASKDENGNPVNYFEPEIIGYDVNGEPILSYAKGYTTEYSFEGFDASKYEGILEIPSLGIRLPVYTDWTMGQLESTPCVFYGGVKENHMVIGAHTYTNHFAHIRFIDDGEVVYFYDITGYRHKYIIDKHEIIVPEQSEYLCKSDYELTLFTCTWYGYKRNAVRCIEVFE